LKSILENPSWPPGKWKVHYEKDIDRYHITTEYGDFIAAVGPTLVAYWLVRVYNALHEEF
jgi:hypothetical protein